MTLVFSDLTESDVTSRFSGTVMTFSKASDAGQKVMVSGWVAEKHSVVFASGMSSFATCASVASPTLAQAKATRAEVWKATDLATA